MVVVRDEVMWIDDLGSTNGTMVNGQRTTVRRLTAGDEIAIGALRLIVEPVSGRTPRPATTNAPIQHSRNYSIERQQADEISNVGGNQYRYDQSYHESNLASIIEKEGRGRRLMITGLLLALLGVGVGVFAMFRFFDLLGSPGQPTPQEAVSRLLPAFVGVVLEIAGIALFIAGLFTKRGARRMREARR